jgi:hypothetical protein
MKLLYHIQTGNVVLRQFSSLSLPLLPGGLQGEASSIAEGYAWVDIPTAIAIPEAILRVIPKNVEHPEEGCDFVLDDSQIMNLWQSIKQVRNQKLKDSDWLFSITDYVILNKAEWLLYRQQLRDMTQQVNPYRIVWPKEPTLVMGTMQVPSA